MKMLFPSSEQKIKVTSNLKYWYGSSQNSVDLHLRGQESQHTLPEECWPTSVKCPKFCLIQYA